MTVLCSRSLGI